MKKSMGAELAPPTSSPGTSTRFPRGLRRRAVQRRAVRGRAWGPQDACRVVDRRRRRVRGCRRLPRRDAVLAWGVNGSFKPWGFVVMKALAPWFTSEQRHRPWLLDYVAAGRRNACDHLLRVCSGRRNHQRESDFSLLCIAAASPGRCFPARGVLSSDGDRSTILAGGFPRDCRPQACRASKQTCQG